MNIDTLIPEVIQREQDRQQRGLELIASENFVSPQVLEAAGSIFTNKYAEGYPGKRYYGGCEVVDEVEVVAIDRLRNLFGAKWANVQPHSGSQANAAVMMAVLKPGDTILGLDLAHGGHLTHGSSVSFSGKLYRSVFYGLDKKTELIDYGMLEHVALTEKPKLIICGASAYSRDWDYAAIRSIADKVGALVLADMAHPAGLIAKGLLKSPLKDCHIVTTTTHKTLRGPRGGAILMGQDFENPFGEKTKAGKNKLMSTILNNSLFPGVQGGPLMHIIAAKAVAFHEASTEKFANYAKQICKNATAMADAFTKRGYKIISGGTDNHLMLVDLTSKNITGIDAQLRLEKVDITVNKNMIPFDTLPPHVTSGIRVGTAAVTTRGLMEGDMERIVALIDETILTHHEEKLSTIRAQVNEWMTPLCVFQERSE